MPAATRQLTAFVALGLAMLLSASCGAPRRTEVALTGSDSTADDVVTTAPSTTAATGVESTTAAAPAPAPAPDASAEQELAAALSAPAADAASTTTTTTTTPRMSSRSTTSTTDPDVRRLDEVEAALEREDICGVYAGLAEFDLSTTSTDRLIGQLGRIRDIMQRAAGFVTSSLRADWTALTDGIAGLLASLEEDRSLGKSSSPSHYDDESYRGASARVGDWMGRNCA